MTLPGYDDWKTHNPDDDRCEFCGADSRRTNGWGPLACTGKCETIWRDPDYERDQQEENK